MVWVVVAVGWYIVVVVLLGIDGSDEMKLVVKFVWSRRCT